MHKILTSIIISTNLLSISSLFQCTPAYVTVYLIDNTYDFNEYEIGVYLDTKNEYFKCLYVCENESKFDYHFEIKCGGYTIEAINDEYLKYANVDSDDRITYETSDEHLNYYNENNQKLFLISRLMI